MLERERRVQTAAPYRAKKHGGGALEGALLGVALISVTLRPPKQPKPIGNNPIKNASVQQNGEGFRCPIEYRMAWWLFGKSTRYVRSYVRKISAHENQHPCVEDALYPRIFDGANLGLQP